MRTIYYYKVINGRSSVYMCINWKKKKFKNFAYALTGDESYITRRGNAREWIHKLDIE